MSPDIRRARREDLPGIAQVTVESWQTTFGGILPADFLLGLNIAQQQRRHANILDRPGVHYHVLVAEGRVVGFASGGPTRFASFQVPHELYAMYLLPSHQRQGFGRELFRRVAADLESAGDHGLLALTLADNPNHGFYARLGGERRDAEPLRLGEEIHAQYAYVWPTFSDRGGYPHA